MWWWEESGAGLRAEGPGMPEYRRQLVSWEGDETEERPQPVGDVAKDFHFQAPE